MRHPIVPMSFAYCKVSSRSVFGLKHASIQKLRLERLFRRVFPLMSSKTKITRFRFNETIDVLNFINVLLYLNKAFTRLGFQSWASEKNFIQIPTIYKWFKFLFNLF